AEGLGGFEVDNQVNFCHLLHWQISRFFTLQNPPGIDTGLPPGRTNVRSVAHETANCREPRPSVNPRHGMMGPQRNDLIRLSKKKTVAAHLQRLSLLLNEVRKGGVNLAWATCIKGQEAHSMSARRNLHFSRLSLGINRVCWVAEISDRRGLGHQFEQ